MTLGPGESRKLSFATPFEPERLVVDPDVKVIQFRRKHATAKL